MKNPDEQELIDKAVAGRLSPEERRQWEALLARRPELEEEAALGRALQSLPPPPLVSSNFTALVLQEINRAKPAPQASGWRRWFPRPQLARLAGTAVVATALGFGVAQQMKSDHQRDVADTMKSLAGDLRVVAPSSEKVQSEAIVAVFNDFEAIRRLPVADNYVDYGLLAALRSE